MNLAQKVARVGRKALALPTWRYAGTSTAPTSQLRRWQWQIPPSMATICRCSGQVAHQDSLSLTKPGEVRRQFIRQVNHDVVTACHKDHFPVRRVR